MVSMLRGVNVGGHNKVPMERLRLVHEELGLVRPQTFIQSGNVVFETGEHVRAELAEIIEAALEKEFGFRPSVVLRSAAELRSVVARNPFADREEVEPNRLLVTFLKSDPGEQARSAVRAISVAPDELIFLGNEIFIHFPHGAGHSKLPTAKIERAQVVSGTARNWNTVLKLLALAEARA